MDRGAGRAATYDYGADETAVLLYTSGTTGRPKGVELTQANLVALTRINGDLAPRADTRVRLISTPLLHVMGQACGLNLAILNCETVVMAVGFCAQATWRVLVGEGATYFVQIGRASCRERVSQYVQKQLVEG